MPSLAHVIYASVETSRMSPAELSTLPKQSRERNLTRDITGILLYSDGSFLQILEGLPRAVDYLYERMVLDSRHTRVTRIVREAIPRRFFSDWSMGLVALTVEELTETLNPNDPEYRERMLASVDEGRAKKLVRAFSEGRWRGRIAQSPGARLDHGIQ